MNAPPPYFIDLKIEKKNSDIKGQAKYCFSSYVQEFPQAGGWLFILMINVIMNFIKKNTMFCRCSPPPMHAMLFVLVEANYRGSLS